MGKWIWMHEKEGDFRENTRACFADSFVVENVEEEITLEICAVTKYMVYINGSYVGRGPIRGEKGSFTYDSYSILPLCRMGENTIAVRVWNYGWSTYQSISDTPGVDFDGSQGGLSFRVGRAPRDAGSVIWAICGMRRNEYVNFGFSDYYDGRKGNLKWIADSREAGDWGYGKVLPRKGEQTEKKSRPIRMLHSTEVYPKKWSDIQM